MWVPLLALVLSLIALEWGADRLLSGAASSALNLGVPKLLIGGGWFGYNFVLFQHVTPA